MSKADLGVSQKISIDRLRKTFEGKREVFPQYLKSPLESVRVLHSESDPLRMDKVGPVIVMGWWSETRPTPGDLEVIHRFMNDALPGFAWYLKWRAPKNVAKASIPIVDGDNVAPSTWTFHENGVLFEARKDQGDAFGLFLDQRDNRTWVRENSQGLRVLNLFAFTCGFSVCAALGGATEVVSVDLYQKYLDWGRRNFELNGLDVGDFKFSKMDSLDYLRWAAKKQKQFDTVICDPPSFSRNGKKVFKVDQSYEALIEACFQVVADHGVVYFSTNFEKWTVGEWEKRIASIGAYECEVLPVAKDFEGFSGGAPIQKTFRLRRS